MREWNGEEPEPDWYVLNIDRNCFFKKKYNFNLKTHSKRRKRMRALATLHKEKDDNPRLPPANGTLVRFYVLNMTDFQVLTMFLLT